MYINFLSLKVDEEITNRLKDEIQLHYGVTIDATTNQHVDNLQIRVSYFYITITQKPLSQHGCRKWEKVSTAQCKLYFLNQLTLSQQSQFQI